MAIEGIDQFITKTATVTSVDSQNVVACSKLHFNTEATVRQALEPLNPSELPKMLEGLRKISKSYPIAETRVEESGEHTIVGTSELQLDQMMHDLRELYAKVEIRVSEPFVSICETVQEASAVRCFAATTNKKNTISMLAEPMEKGLGAQIRSCELFKPQNSGLLAEMLVRDFEWDELTAESVWAFGPAKGTGQNMLVDYTIEGEVDKARLK